jgi:hypothetical protein
MICGDRGQWLKGDYRDGWKVAELGNGVVKEMRMGWIR